MSDPPARLGAAESGHSQAEDSHRLQRQVGVPDGYPVRPHGRPRPPARRPMAPPLSHAASPLPQGALGLLAATAAQGDSGGSGTTPPPTGGTTGTGTATTATVRGDHRAYRARGGTCTAPRPVAPTPMALSREPQGTRASSASPTRAWNRGSEAGGAPGGDPVAATFGCLTEIEPIPPAGEVTPQLWAASDPECRHTLAAQAPPTSPDAAGPAGNDPLPIVGPAAGSTTSLRHPAAALAGQDSYNPAPPSPRVPMNATGKDDPGVDEPAALKKRKGRAAAPTDGAKVSLPKPLASVAPAHTGQIASNEHTATQALRFIRDQFQKAATQMTELKPAQPEIDLAGLTSKVSETVCHPTSSPNLPVQCPLRKLSHEGCESRRNVALGRQPDLRFSAHLHTVNTHQRSSTISSILDSQSGGLAKQESEQSSQELPQRFTPPGWSELKMSRFEPTARA